MSARSRPQPSKEKPTVQKPSFGGVYKFNDSPLVKSLQEQQATASPGGVGESCARSHDVFDRRFESRDLGASRPGLDEPLQTSSYGRSFLSGEVSARALL